MGKAFKFAGAREHYLKPWRVFLRVTLDDMVEAINALPESNGLSKATLSRIENGLIPYTEETLEAYAAILGCSKADLISRRPPSREDEAWTLFEAPTAEERKSKRRPRGKPRS